MYTYEFTIPSGEVFTYISKNEPEEIRAMLKTYLWTDVNNTKNKSVELKCDYVVTIEQFLTAEYQPTSTKLDL